MNRTKWILCNMILKLDKIPRYGRLYKFKTGPDGRTRIQHPPEWRWQKYGRWGLNLLDRLGWLWPWVAETERRGNADSGSVR